MRRFEFRLARLARVRAAEEEIARNAWQSAEVRYRFAEKRVERILTDVTSATEHLRRAQADPNLEPREVLSIHTSMDHLRSLLDDARAEALALRATADAAREPWQELRAELDGLARLEEKAHTSYRQEVKREENKQMDQIASERAARASASQPDGSPSDTNFEPAYPGVKRKMNKFLKLGLFGLGGMGLFAGTFTTVALFSGAPLHEIAGIRMFVGAPDGDGEIAGGTATSEGPSDAPDEPITAADALKANAGILTVFSVPSPFTGSELHKLQDELTEQFRENHLEREKIRVRQLELDEWERNLTDRYAEMADMRTKLEELEMALDLRQAELLRDENISVERERQGWKDLAKLYKGGEPEENATMIAAEDPRDAALILRELGEAQAGEILRLINPSVRKEFMDAYRATAEAP